MLFLIELSSTLGHLSLSIKKSLQMEQLHPCLPDLLLPQGDTPCPSAAPVGTDAPIWFGSLCHNAFLLQKTMICLINYTASYQPI